MNTTLRTIVLLLFGILLLASCEKDGLNYTERRIVGTWRYEKVRVYEKGHLSGDLVTDDYNGIYLSFKEDFTAIYEDNLTDQTWTGEWNLTENYNGDYSVSNLFSSFINDESGVLKQIIFEDISVSRNKLHARFEDHDRNFNYVLIKE